MEVSFEAYLKQLDQLGGILEELTGLTRQKTEAANKGDLETMDAVMRREQALSLSLRGMEQRREALLKGLGLAGTALSALPDHAPENLRLQAKRTAERLLNQYAVYQDASRMARTALECGIHLIEKHMKQTTDAPAPKRSLADIRA